MILDVDELEKVSNGLSSLKSEVDKLDVDKLKIVLVDLKKLSYVVDKELVKKTVHDELVKKVIAIQTIHTTQKLIKLEIKKNFVVYLVQLN